MHISMNGLMNGFVRANEEGENDLKPNEIYAGTMLSEIPLPNMAVLFKSGGLDFFIVDTEHGGFDHAALSGLIMTARLAGITVLVRLADHARRDITRLMDMGADGVLLPMTGSKEDIAAVVRHAKYAPVGRRGISTTRGHTFYAPPALRDYMRQANERTLVFAQIESKAGLDAIEEIVGLNGVDGVIVGPNDLACDLDCLGEAAPILDAIAAVAAAARRHGKVGGIITSEPAFLRHAKANGMGIYCIGSELHMLKLACRGITQQVEELQR